MSLPFRALLSCLLLLPSLVFAQATASPAAPTPPPVRDVPILPVGLGQEVRVTAAGAVQTGRVRTIDPTLLRLTLPDGQQSAVPLAALTQVEVRSSSRRNVIVGSALGGGVLVGVATALVCSTLNGLNDSAEDSSVPACGLVGGAFGAALGGTVGALATRGSPQWKPVWRR